MARLLSMTCSGPQDTLVPHQATFKELRSVGWKSYEALGRPPCDMSPSGAFHELRGQRLPYLGSPTAVAPYEQGRVALPSVGGCPVDTEGKLPPWQRDLLVGSNARMLRCESDGDAYRADLGLQQPYVDDAFRSPRVYGEFVSDLYARGLLCFVVIVNLIQACFL